MNLDQSGTEEDQSKQSGSAAGGWVFPALLVVVLVAVAGITRLGPQQQRSADNAEPTAQWSPTPPPEGDTVGLTIDFGNGASKQFDSLPWREGMTIEELLQEAVRFKPGIKFTHLGANETGFLQSIDGLNNQGVEGLNWKFEVNGQYGEASFCTEELEPGDRVLWRFAGQE